MWSKWTMAGTHIAAKLANKREPVVITPIGNLSTSCSGVVSPQPPDQCKRCRRRRGRGCRHTPHRCCNITAPPCRPLVCFGEKGRMPFGQHLCSLEAFLTFSSAAPCRFCTEKEEVTVLVGSIAGVSTILSMKDGCQFRMLGLDMKLLCGFVAMAILLPLR